MTDLYSIADVVVVTGGMVGRIDNAAGVFIADINRTGNAVIGISRLRTDTANGRVAGCAYGAIVTGRTKGIDGLVDDGVIEFITAIPGTIDVIVRDRWRARLAAEGDMAGLNTIAEESIITIH